MNDATEWIDPELVAAGKLLQSRGLVAPDRTQAPLSEVRAAVDRIRAFHGEGSVPLACERDLSLPGPHGQVPSRLYLPNGNLSATFPAAPAHCFISNLPASVELLKGPVSAALVCREPSRVLPRGCLARSRLGRCQRH